MKRFLSVTYIAAMLALCASPLRADVQNNPPNEETAIESPVERKENALSKTEENREGEEEHIQVGSRSLPHAERVIDQELKAKTAAKREEAAQENTEESILVSESEEEEELSEEVTEEELIAKPTYYTMHQGALHRPIAVTALGDIVTLEDGSEWIVKYSNRYQTLDWLSTDSIIVLPNHAWFSSYYFRLVNQMTGADIEVNLLKGPIYNGVYTHWIIAIDYYNCEVRLEDGSIWKIASGEWGTLKKWLVNDTVILGINDSWLSSRPNILINVNMLNYVTAGPSLQDYFLLPVVTP